MTIRSLLHAVGTRLLGAAVSAADLTVPKNAAVMTFVVGPGNAFSGNLKAFHDHVRYDTKSTARILAHASSDLSLVEPGDRAGVTNVRSWAGLWCLLTSRTVIVEYWSGDWWWPGLLKHRHLFVNVWHGIPVKRIGLAEGNNRVLREARTIGVMIASSETDRAMMSACFNIPYPDVLLTGYPRNDRLMMGRRRNRTDMLDVVSSSIGDIKGDRRLVLYAPTYRGHHLSKGEDVSGVYPFSSDELRKLKQVLSNGNAFLGIRPHINRSADLRIPYDDMIVDMSRNVVKDVQAMLEHTDVLLSDYSGVWVDFLLLDRPVIGFAYDGERYDAERGYLYDYQGIFPGPMVRTFDALLDRLEEALQGTAPMSERHSFAKRLFHTHTDGRCCERLYNALRDRAAEPGGRG